MYLTSRCGLKPQKNTDHSRLANTVSAKQTVYTSPRHLKVYPVKNAPSVIILHKVFYTDNSLNTVEAGIEHIITAYNANNHWANVYLDDQIGAIPTERDNDYTDMTVFVNDVAPVPEPGTILLFGLGLLGLAGITRKQMKA